MATDIIRQGHFGHYSLTNWWNDTFTIEEKQRFKELYKPMGGSYDDLFIGYHEFPKSPVWFLTILAQFASNKADKIISLKFLNKAEELSSGCPLIDKHFLYQGLIEAHYKLREDKNHYESTKEYCKKQISISLEVRTLLKEEFGVDLPGHSGFHQLSIILEKEEAFAEAINICRQAMYQGWGGDWIKRINRLENRKNGT